jgi:hypothetical protein
VPRTPRNAAAAAALALLLAACSSAADTETLIYTLELREGPLWSPRGAATVVQRGDTVTIGLDLYGTAPGGGTLVLVRPDCAVNARIVRDGAAVDSLPAPVSCADSTYYVLIGSEQNTISRRFHWIVPGSAPAGTYVVRGELLQDPVRSLSRAIQVE